MNKLFNSEKYYSDYPTRIILRPGYPARAQYKSTLMWELYGTKIKKILGKVNTYADVGGAFGFGANSMAFHIKNSQNEYPCTKVFDISSDFITIGSKLFPYIDFHCEDFRSWKGDPKVFDLVTAFDVIEHVTDPLSFLTAIGNHSRLALIIVPLETSGELFGSKAPVKQGYDHGDGHIHFYSPNTFRELLRKSNFEILDCKIINAIGPLNSRDILHPESSSKLKETPLLKKIGITLIDYKLLPFHILRKIFGGGFYNCLIRQIR